MMALARVLAPATEPSVGLVPTVWRGTVLEVRGDGLVWVKVPALAGEEPLGPLPVFGVVVPSGTSVLVLAVGGRRDDLVVLPPAL